MKETGRDKEKGMLSKLAENPVGRKIALGLGIGGILLIFASGFFSSGGEGKKEEASETVETMTASQYAKYLQEELKAILSRIEGAEDASVLITLEKDAEQVYASEGKRSVQADGETTDDEEETSYILVKEADGSQKALKITEVQPVVQGVVVVCERGDDTHIQQKIIDAVTTAFHISSARVCVIGSK